MDEAFVAGRLFVSFTGLLRLVSTVQHNACNSNTQGVRTREMLGSLTGCISVEQPIYCLDYESLYTSTSLAEVPAMQTCARLILLHRPHS